MDLGIRETARRQNLDILTAASRILWRLAYSRPGRRLSIIATDLAFGLSRLRNRKTTFADYYAGINAWKLDIGLPHRTLGKRKIDPDSVLAAGRAIGRGQRAGQGQYVLAELRRLGLEPHHTVVDYGCGSLRVGATLIAWLDRGRYWGLDITDRFYRDGLTQLGQGHLDAKGPRFRVIDDKTLAETAAASPDFVVSVAVVKHVPPAELDNYFGRIARLMGRQATLLVYFIQAPATVRSNGKSWSHGADSLRRAATRHMPHRIIHVESRTALDDRSGTPTGAAVLIVLPAQWSRCVKDTPTDDPSGWRLTSTAQDVSPSIHANRL